MHRSGRLDASLVGNQPLNNLGDLLEHRPHNRVDSSGERDMNRPGSGRGFDPWKDGSDAKVCEVVSAQAERARVPAGLWLAAVAAAIEWRLCRDRRAVRCSSRDAEAVSEMKPDTIDVGKVRCAVVAPRQPVNLPLRSLPETGRPIVRVVRNLIPD